MHIQDYLVLIHELKSVHQGTTLTPSAGLPIFFSYSAALCEPDDLFFSFLPENWTSASVGFCRLQRAYNKFLHVSTSFRYLLRTPDFVSKQKGLTGDSHFSVRIRSRCHGGSRFGHNFFPTAVRNAFLRKIRNWHGYCQRRPVAFT